MVCSTRVDGVPVGVPARGAARRGRVKMCGSSLDFRWRPSERDGGVGVLPILRRRLPGPRLRAPRPQVPLVRIGVGLLPAPGRRREHDEEHAHVDLPEPVPLLEAARRENNRRHKHAQTKKVERDALGRVAPDVLLVAHSARAASISRRTALAAAALLLCGRMSRSGCVRLTKLSQRFCAEPMRVLVTVAASRSAWCSSFALVALASQKLVRASPSSNPRPVAAAPVTIRMEP